MPNPETLEEMLEQITDPDELHALLKRLVDLGQISKEQGVEFWDKYATPLYEALKADEEMELYLEISKQLALNEVANATTLSSLTDNIQSALAKGFITYTEADDLYNQHYNRLAEGARVEREAERAQRQDNLNQAWTQIENNPDFTAADKASLRTQVAQYEQDYLAGGSDQVFNILKIATGKVREQKPRVSQLQEALNYIRNNPLITGADLSAAFGQGAVYRTVDDFLQSSLTAQQADDFVTGKSDDFLKKLTSLNQMAEQRGAREGQTADALIAMLNRREPEAPLAPRKAIPSELGVAEEALKATNLGEGTKLRSFIASQIADTAQNVRPERLAWWQRQTAPPEPEEKTYQDELDRMTAEAEKWQKVAAAAPSSEIAGNVAYGPGGLAAIAQKAYAEAQARISKLKPSEDFPLTRTPRPPRIAEEDPLKTALGKKRWWEEYTRLPGVATVPRLQRAVRFR